MTCPLRKLLLVFGFCAFLFLLPSRAQAQTEVQGCAFVDDDYYDCVEVTIAITGAGQEVDGYLEADNTDYYDGEVEDVSVYAEIDDPSGNYVDDDFDYYEPYEAVAEPEGSGIRNSGVYYLYSYVGATVCYDDGEGEGDGYCDDEEEEDLVDGYYVQIDTSQPVIYSLSPNHDVIGASSTLTATGDALVDPQTGQASPSSSDSDLSVQVSGTPSSTQVTLAYQISGSATPDTAGITFTQRFGSSDPKNFFICPAVPSIQQVSPQSLTAGSTVQLTISGSGFGSSPTASITGSGVTSSSSGQGSNTSTQLNVTVAQAAPNGTATVTVTGDQGSDPEYCSPSTTTAQVPVNAVTPDPQIMLNGTNVANTTQTVFAGQLIGLSVPVPTGYTINSQSWQLSSGSSAIGNFVNTAMSGPPDANGGGQTTGLPDSTQGAYAFYFVKPGETGDTVTYTYNLNNGQQAQATVQFVVNGPNGVVLTTNEGVGGVYAFTQPGGGAPVVRASIAGAPSCKAQHGVGFIADESSAAPIPSGYSGSWATVGAWSFVQIINDDYDKELQQDGYQTCRQYSSPTPVIDTTYPYARGQYTGAQCTTTNNQDTAVDSPGIKLDTGSLTGALTHNFNANMYLLWTPPAASGCSAVGLQTCVIPVSLGYTPWSFCTGAINTLKPGAPTNGWVYACSDHDPQGGITHPAFQRTSTYPTWTNNVATFQPSCTQNY